MTQLTARLAIDPKAHQKAQILASPAVRYQGNDQISDLVRSLLEDAWQEALTAGLVKESMLAPTAPSKNDSKKGGRR